MDTYEQYKVSVSGFLSIPLKSLLEEDCDAISIGYENSTDPKEVAKEIEDRSTSLFAYI